MLTLLLDPRPGILGIPNTGKTTIVRQACSEVRRHDSDGPGL